MYANYRHCIQDYCMPEVNKPYNIKMVFNNIWKPTFLSSAM